MWYIFNKKKSLKKVSFFFDWYLFTISHLTLKSLQLKARRLGHAAVDLTIDGLLDSVIARGRVRILMVQGANYGLVYPTQ